MRRPPAHPLATAPHGIAALLGGMLGVLLYALLAWLRQERGAREAGDLEGTLAPVLVMQAGISLETEPYVEWVAVPAPWRNGRLLPKRHARVPGTQIPAHGVRLAGLVRGPPWLFDALRLA